MLFNLQRVFDNGSLVESECGECFLRVTAWRGDVNNAEVHVDIVSNHNTLHRVKLRNRIKRAWQILRYRYVGDWWVFRDPEVLDDFMMALSRAREGAWGGQERWDGQAVRGRL